MHSIKVVDRGYDDVLIVFSALLTKKGKFGLYKQAMALSVNIIYVNDYENNWYLTGTPEFESSLTFINFLLGKIYRLKSKYGYLYTIGGSRGATLH